MMASSQSLPSTSQCTDFTDIFEEARNLLTPKEKKAISATIIEDVHEEAKSIQVKQAKNRALRNMKRIQPYIDGLGRYSEVCSIFAQVKPEILCLIWVSPSCIQSVSSSL
jgi:hypothetical protein